MNKRRLVLISTAITLILCTSMLLGCAEDTSKREDPPPESSADGAEQKTDGYLLTIDGTQVAYIEGEDTAIEVAKHLLGKKKDLLTQEGKAVDEIEMISQFDVTLTKCDPDSITDTDGALQAIEARGIRIIYAVTEREILPIAYETVYKNSSSYYEGVKKVETSGKNGEKQVIYRVEYENDRQTDKQVYSETTLKKATSEVILVGTKKSTASTGSYAWPTKSVYITSRYGWRTIFGSRQYHYGIDLRAAVGTSIYAADGGEVIFVGTSSGYGKLIQIRHDNGDLTYYAHLDSYSVKKGDRVYKRQLIAKSGQTGRVTGPHLHFEIRKNGSRVDPEKYLPKV